MKRQAVVVLGALLASVLVLTPGGAGAQASEFTIDPDTGFPGDLVQTEVDPQAIERECIRTLEEVNDLFAGEGGVIDQFEDFADPQNELEDAAASIALAAMNLIANNIDGLGLVYIDATFVLTFAEVATQEPVGEMSNFDPNIGDGEIVVPDLEPGLWAVAAVCAEPQLTAEGVAAALASGAAFLADIPEEEWLDNAEDLAEAMLLDLVGPRHIWVHPFLIPAERPEPDPAVEAFCGVLPQIQPLAEEIIAALAALPEDDDEMTDEEWAEAFDWDAIGAELRELFEEAIELLAIGDESRAEEVAEEWDRVTGPFRLAIAALEAVDYDLSTPSGRLITGELRAGAAEGGDLLDSDPAEPGESDVDVLVQWFIDNCTGAPLPPAAPAAPVAAQPSFAG